MFVFWGPELIKIYNDGYRPITGHKHPWALGRPAREVWPEIWSDIEPLVARALAGDPTYSDDLMLFMERSGFREEAYFTFSYSPVPDEIGRRRRHVLRLHRDDGAGDRRAAAADAARPRRRPCRCANRRQACVRIDRRARGERGRHPVRADLPAGSRRAACAWWRRPASSAGDPAAPVDGAAADAIWPIAACAATGAAELVTGLADRIGVVPAGPWPEPPPAAMVLPLADRGLGRNVGAIVLGRQRPAPVRRRVPPLVRAARRPDRRPDRQRARRRGRAAAGRCAGGARSGEDDVLLEREPRVPHAAGAHAGPARAGARRPTGCRPSRASTSRSRSATASAC